MPLADLQKRREYGRTYRANNREAIGAQKEKRRTRVHVANPAARMYKEAKGRATKRNLPFDIELSDIKIPLCCPLLGIVLRAGTRKKGVPSPCSPSLDRVRPELGYVKGNVRVLSFLANTMKNAATPEQLRMFAVNVLREHEGRMF